MDGVRILAENTVYDTVYSWGFSWAGLAIGIIAIVFLVLTIIDLVDGENTFLFGIIAVLMFSFGSCFYFANANSEEVFSHTEYKVIIEDGVKFNEFLGYYEIIDQEGEIYTVREKG